MQVVKIASVHWTILAVCDQSDECLVLSLLEDLANGNRTEQSLATKMFSLLREFVPERTTNPRVTNENMSKKLEDDLFEFKRGSKKGPKVRVLYFYESGRTIVCTHAFLKSTQTTPELEKATARTLRDDYRQAASAGRLNTITFDQWEANHG